VRDAQGTDSAARARVTGRSRLDVAAPAPDFRARPKAVPVLQEERSLSATPRITVGMPVYNGAATIGASIEALLAQTFGDFELAVSDNASTDSTGDVVQALARRDPRIRYVRQARNVGANRNFSFVAREARGEFLKWASASDWCAPTFLERCLVALERDPGAVLAAPRTRLFEGDLLNARDYPDDVAILDATPAARLVHLNRDLHLNNAMNGLIRMSALRRTRMIETFQWADMVLMGHLALMGKFLLVDERLFYRRMEAATATALQDSARASLHLYPTPTARMLLQRWRRHLGSFRAALTTPMQAGERLRVLSYLARSVVWDRQALAADLRGVWRYVTRRSG
jgi:glycosyltransferase involved in cell wall biosynthesis